MIIIIIKNIVEISFGIAQIWMIDDYWLFGILPVMEYHTQSTNMYGEHKVRILYDNKTSQSGTNRKTNTKEQSLGTPSTSN